MFKEGKIKTPIGHDQLTTLLCILAHMSGLQVDILEKKSDVAVDYRILSCEVL